MEKIIDNIISMMKIKSISGNQTEIAEVFDFIKQTYGKKGVFINLLNFENASPIMILANCQGYDFDVAAIGHIDVVPAHDKLFIPRIDGNKLYGRGGFDMKASVAVCLDTLLYTVGKNIRFGVILTSDEETSSNGMKALQKANFISSGIVLDPDSGDNINKLVEKYKHPVSIEITAQGENAHSSQPWQGINAINSLINTIKELEKSFPQYGKNQNIPDSTWVDTMVVTAFNSPITYNVVPNTATARLNFRLTEKTSLPQLEKLLNTACTKCGSNYKILLSSSGVYMNADNPIIKKYMSIAENITGNPIQITHSCGATDSRMFAARSTIIMHCITGANAHGDEEYAEIDSILQLSKIQKAFVDAIS